MQHHRASSTAHQQALQLLLLRDFADHIADLELDTILTRLTQLLQRQLHASIVAIALVEADQLVLRSIAAQAAVQPALPKRVPLEDSGLVAWATRHGEPVLVGDSEADPCCRQADRHPEGRSRLIVPLAERSNVIGVIDLRSEQENAFDKRDLDSVITVAEYATLAISHALLRQAERERQHELERLKQSERVLFADIEQSYNELLLTLSELDQRDEQLRRSERLNVLGQLASGVAHDFNNLLVGIIGNAEFLLADEVDAERAHSLRVIEQAAQDSAAIVRRIQEFARQSHSNADDLILLPDIIEGALAITKPRWHTLARREGRAIALQREIDTLPPVLGNGAELRELMVNLILNAVDAMPNGGELRIRLLREQELSIGGPARSTETQMAILEVSDNGIGMTADQQARVFEMFYSTKPPGKGSGLGLPICRQIAERHGGRIEVESAPARGTTFRVLLPLVDQALAGAGTAADQPSAAPLRILVVDDDRSVRDVLVRMLHNEGHQATAVSTAAEAIGQFTAGAFDLLFTDLSLADMDGRSLLSELRAADPRLPAVVMTGWGDAELPLEADAAAASVLTKPFSIAEVRQVIHELILGDAV